MFLREYDDSQYGLAGGEPEPRISSDQLLTMLYRSYKDLCEYMSAAMMLRSKWMPL